MAPALTLLLWLLPAALALAEAPVIPDFEARYGIYKGPLKIGEAHRRLRDPVYEARTEPVGLAAWLLKLRLHDLSRIQWVAGRPRPVHYEQRREGRNPRTIVQDYDWTAMVAISRYNGEPFEIPLTPDAVDQNMYQLALMADLKQGREVRLYRIVEGKRMEHYPVRQLGTRRIDTPWGRLEAVGLERRGKKERTVLWCAPALHYLPVRIVHDGDGGRFEARLEWVEGLGAPRQAAR